MARRREELYSHIPFDQNVPKYVLTKVRMTDVQYKASVDKADRMSFQIQQHLANPYMAQNLTLSTINN